MPNNELHSTSLRKSLKVLEHLAAEGRALSFSEIVAGAQLPKSTGHRLLSVLVNERLVLFDAEAQTYRIGLRFMSLAFQTWHRLDLRRAAEPHMRRLADATGENVHLAVRDGAEIVYIERVESQAVVRMHAAVGARAPLHCTALGKAMLALLEPSVRDALIAGVVLRPLTPHTITSSEALVADLEAQRTRGYARDRSEHQPDVHCVAAPIRNFRGAPIAAISVSAPTFRVPEAQMEGWGELVAAAACRISIEAGWVADMRDGLERCA